MYACEHFYHLSKLFREICKLYNTLPDKSFGMTLRSYPDICRGVNSLLINPFILIACFGFPSQIYRMSYASSFCNMQLITNK